MLWVIGIFSIAAGAIGLATLLRGWGGRQGAAYGGMLLALGAILAALLLVAVTVPGIASTIQ